MNFGIHAFVFNDGQNQKDLELAITKTRDTGFGILELPGVDPNVINIDRLAKRAAVAKITLLASYGLPPEFDVSSTDSGIAKAGEAFLKTAVNVARDLGCTQLSGPIYSGHQKFQSLPLKQNWDTSIGVLARVAAVAKRSGITLCMEVLNRYETNLINTAEQGLHFIQATGAKNIKLHLDSYHMNIEEASSANAIVRTGANLGYFHVNENHRGYLGTGTINFAQIFDALLAIRYKGAVSVEAFNNAAMGDKLRAILGSWRDVWTDDMAFARHAKSFLDLQLQQAQLRAKSYAGTKQ
jgi:D-psicose/D-tagatose/L-ribulose 3-epimerase